MAETLEHDPEEELTNVCSTCMRRSHQFCELKPNETTLVEKVFGNYQKSNSIFHVCVLCKMALDFVAKFERICEMSHEAVEKFNVIEIRTDNDTEDDAKTEAAFAAICQWASDILEENMKVWDSHENSEEMLSMQVKTEVLMEEYLVESDYEGQDQEEIPLLEAKTAQRKSQRSKELAAGLNCEICQQKCLSKAVLNKHLIDFHGLPDEKPEKTEVLNCTEDDCDFKASSQLKLNRHLQSAHSIVVRKTFCCDVCGQVYPSKCRLQYHMNCHLNISPFLCDFEGCTRTFRNPTRLRNHKQEFHLQVIRMHCSICGKGFRTKASHDLHILGHDKPTIPCEVCGRLLTNRKTLRTHLMTHTGERRYKCEVEGCNKAFTKCSGLQVHMRSHTKERPYKCPNCNLTFAYKVSMKKHMLKYHDIPFETSTHVKPEPQKEEDEDKINGIEIKAS